MCGFIQRDTGSPATIALLNEVGLEGTIPLFHEETSQGDILNFYPAFGGNVEKRITNLIVDHSNTIHPTWWFDAKINGDNIDLGKRTTFNARNLDSPYWQKAITRRRGIVVATAVGESNLEGKGKSHYLMRPKSGALLLGAVYRVFSNGCFSCAVVTRPPREDFSKYHEKSIPFFLPHDKSAINAWISNEDSSFVNDLLANPQIYTDLEVTKVKTFKSGEAISPTDLLPASQPHC